MISVLALPDNIPDQQVQSAFYAVSQHVGKSSRDVLLPEDLTADGVVDIMVDIGHLIGKPHHIALQRGRMARGPVIHDAVPDLPGQVQPLPVLLQNLDNPHALPVMGKSSRRKLIQDPLPRMAEGRVSDVMSQGNGLGQGLVQPEAPGNGSGNLCHLQRVGKPGPVMVPFRGQKNLRLVLHPPKCLAVQDSVPVPLVYGAHVAGLLLPVTAARVHTECRIGTQILLLPLFFPLSDVHSDSLRVKKCFP